MIQRLLADTLQKDFFRGKILVITGPRQAGKTTLVQQLQIPLQETLVLNCDDHSDAEKLENPTTTDIQNLIGGYRYVFIDEAQRVNNIGLTLKMIADLYKDRIQVVVTGSSSFDLNNSINEPATGRLLEYRLYPLSLSEIAHHTSWHEADKQMEQRLIYGSYPEVVTDPAHAIQTLTMLTNNYLYKDILSYKGMRKPDVLQRLLQALALQVGSEVSYTELSRTIGIDKVTVENYIDLLEKCFVIFRLSSFSRNMRTEIRKGKKVYFYDNGIRNALIRNFAPTHLRQDTGMLWENLMMSERMKHNALTGNYANLYFWRTHDKQEIDLIEERDVQLHCYEFKYNPRRSSALPASFANSYGDAEYTVITTGNYKDFVE